MIKTGFGRYNKLCERYRYRRYYVDFSDVPIDECKKRNQLREEEKRVPESVIDKMYSRILTQPKTSGWVELDKDKFWDELNVKLFDLNKYNNIYIFGDIHGCYSPLKEFFDFYPYNENDMYIFVGDYSVDIDNIFIENEENVIQVHGHRNTFEIDGNGKSVTLEGKIEFGGNLKILKITKNALDTIIKIRNNVYGVPQDNIKEDKMPQETNMLERLRLSRYIRETKLENNISSFNFTRDAFFKKKWDDVTCTARGLFIDTEKNKVVARGYEKFFNVNEVKATELEHLLQIFKGKITCYKKENGFLGILSLVNGELFYASKSTNQGEFANYFKNIFDSSNINTELLIEYLKNNDVSFVFEVIDIENDPHIIKYDKSKVILLDIINNDYEFIKKPYNEVQKISMMINCECKSIYKEFDDIRKFHAWYLENTDEDNMTHIDIEGVVIENGNIMTKLKFPYYRFWKQMRGLSDKVVRGKNIKLASLYNAESNYFYAWLKEQDQELLSKDIITIRDEYNRRSNN